MITQKANIEAIHEDSVKVKIDQREENGVLFVHIHIGSEQPIQFPKVNLVWHHPIVDIQSYWHPGSSRSKSFGVDWDGGFSSKATVLAPVGCFYNQEGQNRLAVAYSNAMDTVNFNLGVHEETGTMKAQITLFTEPSKVRSSYDGVIRVDMRDIPYYQAIQDISVWYEEMDGYGPSFVPETAKLPMYSTWYSFHQDISDDEIEKQCEIAKQLGCGAVIVDDGWQTEDDHRGYAYCGDWEVSPKRIVGMREHVERVHDLGMKYLLWYSVPFVGIYSKTWERFRSKILYFNDSLQAGVLDPRYPEVREYLISTYEKALKEWDLDGFKFDFIDLFDLNRAKGQAIQFDPERDYESVQEAVDRLFTDIMESLKLIKPSIMVEFRQRYIGPYMRKYGNIFRVGDCPNDAITNRVGIMDLRLLSGNTAVHSDMIMWSPEDTTENAALQLINVIFGVPQFSMRFEKLNKDHFEMAKFWLGFSKKYQDVLLNGDLKPTAPELLYPIVETMNDSTRLITIYADVCIKTGTNIPEEFIIVNGTLNEEFILDLEKDLVNITIETYSCTGNLIRKHKTDLFKGLHRIETEKSGVLIFRKA
ncbi:glycoside hydrolase family 36 protein [Bacillus sp. 166amftsu]|uniref:glycoside hydrolase family 36 protein n=1 Tax=Bacillus sp. 166amftsu TaxID=1761753 RepID=UPI00089AAC22|nr:glycoside hydrolase family 36 protein [Bacillus sp. 166amftsu]SDY83230.1 alpha-galactosidase [Bacillus sp. 166amftsu]